MVLVLREFVGWWSSSDYDTFCRTPSGYLTNTLWIIYSSCSNASNDLLKIKQTKRKTLPTILKLANWLLPASLVPYFTIFSTNHLVETTQLNLHFRTLHISCSLLCYCCFFSQKIYILHHDIFQLSYKKCSFSLLNFSIWSIYIILNVLNKNVPDFSCDRLCARDWDLRKSILSPIIIHISTFRIFWFLKAGIIVPCNLHRTLYISLFIGVVNDAASNNDIVNTNSHFKISLFICQKSSSLFIKYFFNGELSTEAYFT